jgi:hypothetical protein
MRNIVWQAKERIAKGEKPPLKELLRTFWYILWGRSGRFKFLTQQFRKFFMRRIPA